MSMNTCAGIEEALPAYALGALEETERAAVQAHLRTCEACRRLAAEYAAVPEALLLSAPARLPPPDLKQTLMARVAAKPAGAGTRAWARLRAPARSPRFGYALALAVAAIAVVAWLVQMARWSSAQADLQARLRQQEQALAALVGREVQVVALAGKPAAQDASGSIRFAPEGTVAVLWAEDLPPLPASQSYQLWLIYADGTRDSGAVFSVPADGSATVVVVAPKPFSAYARFGISVEPAGGSPAPTGPAALAS